LIDLIMGLADDVYASFLAHSYMIRSDYGLMKRDGKKRIGLKELDL
jgi:hypothetical protein